MSDVLNGILSIDPLQAGEVNIKDGILDTTSLKHLTQDKVTLGTLSVLVQPEEDANDSVPNTNLKIRINDDTVTDEGQTIPGVYKAKGEMDFQYRRLLATRFSSLLGPYEATIAVNELTQEVQETKIDVIKATLYLSGVRVEDLDISVVQETVHYKLPNALFSNIDKGVLIKAKENSYLYVGELYIPFIQNFDSENAESLADLLKKAEAQKKKEEEARKNREKAEADKRAKELEALKKADARRTEEANKPAPPTVGGTPSLNPSDWTGGFEEPDLPPAPEPKPNVPPPVVPDIDEPPTPPAPPPIETPPPKQEPVIRVGGFENYNEVAKSHLVYNIPVDEPKTIDYVRKMDIHLDKDKRNPDNPYLYTGVSKTVQGVSLSSIVDNNEITRD